MKTNLLFLFSELLKAARGQLKGILLWALALVLALAAGTALLVLPGGGEESRPFTQAFLLASLSPDLSEQDINELAWHIWEREGVGQVSFRFPGEEEPTAIEERTLLVLLEAPELRTEVQGLLAKEAGILEVSYLERTVKPPPRLPSVARILALVGLVFGLALVLWLGRLAMGGLARDWGEALRLLRACGLPELVLRFPFLAVGGLVGLVAGLFYVGLLWGMLSWAQGEEAVRQAVPLFLSCGPLATGLGLLVAIILGVVGGMLGYPPRTAHS
ncbi:hypothetical protein H5T52_05660 [Candidatus Bipolaricaulota bacterium]|nr:hypothetical protein [Candidatus Bipolaricaulota bacterium]